jgi:hypothetical protein
MAAGTAVALCQGMLPKPLLAAAPVVLLAAALGCGGKVDTSLLPECPANGSCTSDCKQTVTDCAGTHELACTCDPSGVAQCPDPGAPNCQNDCDALMQNPSASCSIEGEKCLAPMQNSCLNAPTLYCTCVGGTFSCDVPPPNCPEPVCPAPSQVHYGAPCNGFGLCPTDQTVTDCDGNVVGVVECSCMNGTFGECVAPPMPDCPDAGPPLDAGVFDGGGTD